MIEKVIRDGNVAVIYAPGYGAGWYSWSPHTQLLFHPKLVEMIETGKQNEIDDDWCKEHLGLEGVYCGGNIKDLTIKWLPEGTKFRIDEYDGNETIVVLSEKDYITA